MMRIIIDANIIISALLRGNIIDIILSPHLEFVAPGLLFEEIMKHKDEIIRKSSLSESDVEQLIQIIEKHVSIIPLESFIHLFEDAELLLKDHVKDAPYIALALHLNCPFWTYEKRFSNIGRIQCLSTTEVARLISGKRI